MINRIAQFYKVSYEQWVKDMQANGYELCSEERTLRDAYDRIELPTRATIGSSGYDFKSPFDFTLAYGETIVIPTGIRASMDEGWWLMCMPKSGQGFKYRVQLDNTIANIDSDYYFSDNEGHILVKLTHNGAKRDAMSVRSGQGFMQAVFVPYGITYDDNASGVRNGGFGSTGK